MSNTRDKCHQCGTEVESGKWRCRKCYDLQNARRREQRMERKQAGECVRCGVVLPLDSDTLWCEKHRAILNAHSRRSRRRTRAAKVKTAGGRREMRERKTKASRARYALRRSLGLCAWCDEKAEPGTLRCTEHREEQAAQNRARRAALRSGKKPGGQLEAVCALIEQYWPGPLSPPLSAAEIRDLVEAQYGPLSPTRASADRAVMRAIAEMLKGGRIVRHGDPNHSVYTLPRTSTPIVVVDDTSLAATRRKSAA